MDSDAVDLDGQQDWDSELLEISGGFDGSGATPALAEENYPSIRDFFRVEAYVVIRIERLPDEFERKRTPVIGDRFGVDAGLLAKFENELANAAMFVVPVVVSAEEADDEG